MKRAGRACRTKPRTAWGRAGGLAWLALVCAVLAGCGGSDSEPAAPAAAETGSETASAPADTEDLDARVATAYGSGRACPAPAVVSEALGEPMEVNPNSPSIEGFSCSFRSTDQNVTVSLTFSKGNETAYPEPDQEALPGLGETALWSDDIVGELEVWTGNDSVLTTIYSGRPVDRKAAAVALTKAILGEG